MFIPRPFTVDQEQAFDLLSEISVGHLVTATAQGPMSTFLPWILDADRRVLVGHMARQNPQWQTPWLGQALVVAQGPNGYVSPSWYPTKIEHGRVVPTWNYLVVHAYGELVICDDHSWVDTAVRRLSDLHEQGREVPWTVDDAPGDYIDGQLNGIVGIELRIDRVEAAVKMSQNKSEADAAGVVAGFIGEGNHAVANWVELVTS